MLMYVTDLINQPDKLVIQSDHVFLLAGFTRRVDLVPGRVAPGRSGAAGGVGLAAVVSSFRHPAACDRELKTGGCSGEEDTSSPPDHLLFKVDRDHPSPPLTSARVQSKEDK